jgi:hypothetical protein
MSLPEALTLQCRLLIASAPLPDLLWVGLITFQKFGKGPYQSRGRGEATDCHRQRACINFAQAVIGASDFLGDGEALVRVVIRFVLPFSLCLATQCTLNGQGLR